MILLRDSVESILFIKCTGISNLHNIISIELDMVNYNYMGNDQVKLQVDNEIYKIISRIHP